MNLFVDTNVLLDVLAGRQPFIAAAERVWALAEARRVRAYISAISYNNCYYVVRKARNRAAAAQAVRLIRGVFTTVALSEQILNHAIDAGFEDFEDAIQFHSAVEIKASCLITRNPDHFPTNSPAILTPAEFLATHFFPGSKP